MSKLSIYENNWINLVFEGKNKEYGAYQLRQESDRTTLFAFLMGLLLITILTSIPIVIHLFSNKSIPEIALLENPDVVIHLSSITPPEIKKPKQLITPIEKKPLIKNITKKDLLNVEIVKPTDANQNITNTNEHITNTIVIPEGSVIQGTTTTISKMPGTEIINPKDSGGIENTAALDKLPEFPGGIGKFYSFVGTNFEKPEIETDKSIRVYVSFVIEKDGSMTDIQVRKDPGYGLGIEAIRVLKSLKTKWSPGMIAGKPVRTAYNLPIIVEMK